MKTRTCILLALSLLVATPAAAQDAAEDNTIVVTGVRDRAMDAFMRGDFFTAEEEFKDNVRCIERVEMLQDFAIEQAITDATRAALSGGPPANAVGDAGAPQAYNIAPPGLFSTPARANEIAERTCHSEEWQHYMIGLSQIQLGKLDEAKYSLERAARMTNDELLYDAHFRVGLLELLDGEVDMAARRLTRLRSIQRNCNARGTSCEVHADLDVAVAYLARAVSEARRGIVRR